MTQKEKYEMILEKLNIKEYFDSGYKGQNVKVASVESLKSEHGRNVYLTLKTYAPLCDVYSFNDEFGISATGDQNTPDTINFPKFVDWCIEKEIRIVSSSLQWQADEPEEKAAIQKLYDNGIIFFNCAGNDGDEDNFGDGDDASNIDEGVISVSSVSLDYKGRFSWTGYDYGEAIDVVTIGSNLPILYDADKFMTWSGTSASTPLKAAMTADMISANEDINSKNIEQVIEDSSEDFEYKGIKYKRFVMPSLKILGEYGLTWQEMFEKTWNKATKLGVVDGTRKNEYITRNELVVILERLGLLK